MPGQIPENVQKKVADRLAFYDDLGIRLFYRDRHTEQVFQQEKPAELAESENAVRPAQIAHQEPILPKTSPRPGLQKVVLTPHSKIAPLPLPAAPAPSLFDAANKIADDTLLRIREDLGECTRCKLHKHRHSIVFGSGNPKAELVFVGEGPGADEDEQGLPFVGRAGQLLTEMIERGMKIPRSDVYICNIIKCRPPENRKPEKDEVAACRQFVERQLDAVRPRVICALGATAAETMLETKESMGRLRGRWFEFRGIPLVVTYHPAFLLRDPTRKRDTWEDLKLIL